MQIKLDMKPNLREIPNAQRLVLACVLADYASAYKRNEAIAYLSGHHTMAAIGDHFGVNYTTVSRLVKQYEAA